MEHARRFWTSVVAFRVKLLGRDCHTMEWIPTKVNPPLGAGELHVWRIHLANLVAKSHELRAILSAEEVSRSDRYIRSADSAKFVSSRAALRRILAGYLGQSADRVVVKTGEFGKP